MPVDHDGELPSCAECRGAARPNVLMFGDFAWISDVSEAQHERYRDWLGSIEVPLRGLEATERIDAAIRGQSPNSDRES